MKNIKRLLYRLIGIRFKWCIRCHKETKWQFVDLFDEYQCLKCGNCKLYRKMLKDHGIE